MNTKQRLTLRELTNDVKEYYTEDQKYELLHNTENIVKAISDVLKTFDWGYYTCKNNRYEQIKWHMQKFTEDTVEIDEVIWLKIVIEALTILNYTIYDFESFTVRDYITDSVMSYAKNHNVISDYTGSFKDCTLRVTLFIDGPRGDDLAGSFDNDKCDEEEK